MTVDFVTNYFYPTSILDIGAHSGDFYRECTQTFPDAYYFLIEANVECTTNLDQLNVPYFIGLLSDTTGFVDFYRTKTSNGCNSASTGNSIYREKTNYYNDENVWITKEPTFLLDEVVDRPFDLIKLDVQGAELNVLRGGLNTVQHAKGIIMEVSVIEYNQHAPLESEVMAFMNDLGFVPKQIVGTHTHPETHEHIQTDVFFVRKDV